MYKIIKNLLFFNFFKIVTAAVPQFRRCLNANCSMTSSSDLTTGQVRIVIWQNGFFVDFVPPVCRYFNNWHLLQVKQFY